MAYMFEPSTTYEMLDWVEDLNPRPKLFVFAGRHEPRERTISVVERMPDMDDIVYCQFPPSQMPKSHYLALADALDEVVDDLCKGKRLFGDRFSDKKYKETGETLKELIARDQERPKFLSYVIGIVDNNYTQGYASNDIFSGSIGRDLHKELWDLIKTRSGFLGYEHFFGIVDDSFGLPSSLRAISIDLHAAKIFPPPKKGHIYEKRMRQGIYNGKITGVATPSIQKWKKFLRFKKKLETSDVDSIVLSRYLCGAYKRSCNYNTAPGTIILEFFQNPYEAKLLLTEEQKRKILPAVNFGDNFERGASPYSLVSAKVSQKKLDQNANGLRVFLENLLKHYKYLM